MRGGAVVVALIAAALALGPNGAEPASAQSPPAPPTSDEVSYFAPVVEGPLALERVVELLEEERAAVAACWARPHTRGDVHLFFFVGADGAVFKADVARTSLDRPDVETCIVREAVTWRLAGAEAEGVTVVDVVIQFR